MTEQSSSTKVNLREPPAFITSVMKNVTEHMASAFSNIPIGKTITYKEIVRQQQANAAALQAALAQCRELQDHAGLREIEVVQELFDRSCQALKAMSRVNTPAEWTEQAAIISKAAFDDSIQRTNALHKQVTEDFWPIVDGLAQRVIDGCDFVQIWINDMRTVH